MRTLLLPLLIALILVSCVDDGEYDLQQSELDIRIAETWGAASQGEGLSYFVLPSSDDLNVIPQDPLNPLTREKVALGKLLVHETATAGVPKMSQMEGTYSCASCHPVASSFYSAKRQGVGESGTGFGVAGESRVIDLSMPLDSVDIQPVRPPTLLNVAYQKTALWNGMLGATGPNASTASRWQAAGIPENNLGFEGLETQGIVGQVAHRLKIDEEFVDRYGYRGLFDAAFPEVDSSERYSQIYAGLAIAAFNRTILANESPWQDYLKGSHTVLSDQEKRGALLFAGKAACINCHTGPALKDNSFHAWGFGHFDNSPDAIVLESIDFETVKRGRGGFTGIASDDFKFKTPTLYNLRDAGFYGHGSTFSSIEEVIRYKAGNNLQDPEARRNLAIEMGSVDLTEDEIEDLSAFLNHSLYDPYLVRYVPETVLSGNCFPNADLQSKIDLGCE
ncbi:MAG: cytochrome c peroxidase [Nonlabens sp.]